MGVKERMEHYLIRPLEYGANYGMTDNDMFYTAAKDAAAVMKLISEYAAGKQSPDTDPRGAVMLVTNILDTLKWYQ